MSPHNAAHTETRLSCIGEKIPGNEFASLLVSRAKMALSSLIEQQSLVKSPQEAEGVCVVEGQTLFPASPSGRTAVEEKGEDWGRRRLVFISRTV